MKLYTLKVKGMRSALDVSSIERLLKKIDGIDAVNINIVNAVVKVRCADEIELETITGVIADNGYSFYEKEEQSAKTQDVSGDKKHVCLHSIIFAAVLVISVILYLHEYFLLSVNEDLLKGAAAAELILSGFMLYSARKFICDGIKELVSGNPLMSSLPVLGCLTAYIYSAVNVFYACFYNLSFAYNLYFLPVVLLLLMQKTGAAWIDSAYNIKCYEPLKEEIFEDKVILVKGDESIEITRDMVLPGDVIHLTCRQTACAEGTVVAGEAAVDECMVNGKSMPVLKKKGETLYYGSVICGGSINLQVLSAEPIYAAEKQVHECDLTSVFNNNDKAAVYLPVIIIAVIVACLNWFFYTGNLNSSCQIAAAVLLISAPELVSMSVAASVKSALKKGRKQGIYFKSIRSMFESAAVSMAVIGKTTTLTKNIAVTDIVTFNGVNEQSAVCLAASLETESLHPIATAIKNCITQNSSFDCSNVKYSPGCGVKGIHQKVKVALGTYEYMRKICRIPGYIKKQEDEFTAAGKTVVYLAAQNQICALFALSEELNEEDKRGIKSLHDLDIRTMLITGDNGACAERAAKYFQISRFMSELSIKDKCQLIHSLQQGGEKIAVFSENLCDRSLYQYADIGVSMSGTTRNSADIILAKHDFSLFTQGVLLSRRLLQKIQQHLKMLFIFNLATVAAVLCLLYGFADIVLHPLLITAVMLLNFLLVITTS